MNALTPPLEFRGAVLLVEDDDSTRTAVTRILQASGFLVLPAPGYREGAECIRNARFDLIVSDYRMPDGTGLMLYEELRRAHVRTPFLLISGDIHVTISDRRFRFLPKPFTSVELMDTLRPFFAATTNADSVEPPLARTTTV